MNTELIGILINALVVIGGYYANSKVTKYRIDSLEEKVEKHNNVIEKTYILGEKVNYLDQQVSELKGVIR